MLSKNFVIRNSKPICLCCPDKIKSDVPDNLLIKIECLDITNEQKRGEEKQCEDERIIVKEKNSEKSVRRKFDNFDNFNNVNKCIEKILHTPLYGEEYNGWSVAISN